MKGVSDCALMFISPRNGIVPGSAAATTAAATAARGGRGWPRSIQAKRAIRKSGGADDAVGGLPRPEPPRAAALDPREHERRRERCGDHRDRLCTRQERERAEREQYELPSRRRALEGEHERVCEPGEDGVEHV